MKFLAVILTAAFLLLIAVGVYKIPPDSVFAQTAVARVAAITDPVREWEHGFRTSRVIATRYSSARMGYNIGFTFPKNPNDCDRAELSDFMEAHGGNVYESGGSPGAEMFVTFEGVTDKETANKKLREILPALTELITDIGDGKQIAPQKPKEPPLTMEQWIAKMNAKKEKCGEDGLEGSGTDGYNSWSVECQNGVRIYRDTSEGTRKAQAETEARRFALWGALNTRCLSDKEMQQVLAYGDMLNIPMGIPYSAEDKATELRNAMARQTMLCSREQKGKN